MEDLKEVTEVSDQYRLWKLGEIVLSHRTDTTTSKLSNDESQKSVYEIPRESSIGR